MSQQSLIDPTKEKVISLDDETRFSPDGIVSRTILNTPSVRVTLFGFAQNQELSRHTSTSSALVQVLSGQCDFSVDGKWHRLNQNDYLYVPAKTPHALKAVKQFSMLLTLFKPGAPNPAEDSADSFEPLANKRFSLDALTV